jgi:hypothetical protein
LNDKTDIFFFFYNCYTMSKIFCFKISHYLLFATNFDDWKNRLARITNFVFICKQSSFPHKNTSYVSFH